MRLLRAARRPPHEHRASSSAAGPARADFALYGQLTQLVGFDPTPTALALRVAPRVVAWVDVVEDLSGLEPQRRRLARRATRLPATLRALLGEVGRVYAPFLLANADALARGAERVECTIDGRPWMQRPFPYQGKCLTLAARGATRRSPPATAARSTRCSPAAAANRSTSELAGRRSADATASRARPASARDAASR